MSWAIEEMFNIVWYLAAVGADVEANILTDSALVGAEESTMSGSKLLSWARVVRSFRVNSFSEMLIAGGRSSNTTFLPKLVTA